MSKQTQPMRRWQLWMPTALLERLRKIARIDDRSVAWHARKAIVEYVSKRKQKE